MANQWTQKDITNQKDKVVIVTGGNSGIGYEAGLALAEKNARVILAVRSVDKGEQAAQTIRQRYPAAEVKVMALNLADLKSIHSFADIFLANHDRLDIFPHGGDVPQGDDMTGKAADETC